MLLIPENKPFNYVTDFQDNCDECEYCEGVEDGTYYYQNVKYISVRCKDDPRYNCGKRCPKERATGVAYGNG